MLEKLDLRYDGRSGTECVWPLRNVVVWWVPDLPRGHATISLRPFNRQSHRSR